MKHIRTRLFGITLSFIMLISLLPVTALAGGAAWDGTTVDANWYNDSDTEFIIYDSADLAGLAKLVNAGNNFSGKTIKLGADIDLGGKEWTPIGTDSKPFKGTFDGAKEDNGNYTISNLYINKGFSNTVANSYVGLFGLTNSPAVIKNVDFENVDIQGGLYVGTVVGYGFTGKEISNCHVSGKIEIDGWWYIGGIGGNGYVNKVDGCSVTGEEGSYIKGNDGSYVGGIWGYRGEGNMTIPNCSVANVAISGVDRVGGISGIAHYGNTIKDCTISSSTITTTNNIGNTGLIAGADLSSATSIAKILDCTVTNTTATSEGVAVTTKIGSCNHEGTKNETPATVGTDVVFASDGADEGKIISGTLEQVYEGSLASTVVAVPQEDGTLKVEDMTTGNAPVVVSIGATTTAYKTLEDAIAAANAGISGSAVTVTIQQSGNYAPFTITRANVTVEAADDVEATITVSSTDSVKNTIKASNVTLRNLDFISEDGASIIYYVGGQNPADSGNDLTLDGCTFTGDGTGTALFIHQPDITITGCTFQNFERGYYTCGDNHAAGEMIFTHNTFTNVRVPIDGYWGKPAGANTDITITGNTIDPGNWGTAYLQLWDYAQYQHWLNGRDSVLNPDGASAIRATIEDNAYNGNVVIYATHFNWFSQSNLTMDQAAKDRVKYRVLVELENAASATVTNADGSAITAFNENTSSSNLGGKKVIYAISEGDYIFNIKPTGSAGDGLVTESVTVKPTTVDPFGKTTNKVTVDASEVYVAQVRDTKYATLAEAIQAAKDGGTVELLNNISIDTWNQVWDAKDLTINGNGHTVTVKKIESKGNGDYLFYGAENLNVSNLTVNLPDGDSGFSMVSGKLEGVTVNGGVYAVATGAAPDGQKVVIKNCTFTGQSKMAIYTQENGNAANTVIDGCTFNSERAVILRNNEQFTNNTVKGSEGVTIYSSATATVTGNTFTEGSRLKVYDTKSTIERNKLLGNVVLDGSVPENNNEISLDKNYWGEGRTPSSVLLNDASKVDGGKTEYYVHPAMRPSDLNTYVPPTTGGGSSSSGDYLITVDKTTGGKVTVNPGRADKGDEVTITVKPNDGYELDQLSVTDKDGDSVKVTNKGNGKYTFTMPGSQITIKATFKAAESSALDNFTDVNSNAWYADAVEFVIEEGLMTGTSDTTFAPDTSMSRAMIWTVLAAYNGANTSGGNPWYAPSQQWAMINGVSDGSAPNGSITREQLAVMLWRAAGSPSTSKNLTGYADANAVSDWAVEALAWAVDNGIISGMSGSSLAPQNTATRAQVAVMLMQFVECMDA